MPTLSAGIALYRKKESSIELLLVHPGGPLWAGRDFGAWSFPKGEHDAGEDALRAARREFEEELGFAVEGTFVPLAPRKVRSGKVVSLWAVEGDCSVDNVCSNTFKMEWPPKSGRHAEFPEVDRAGWFDAPTAKIKLTRGQVPFVDEICALLHVEIAALPSGL